MKTIISDTVRAPLSWYFYLVKKDSKSLTNKELRRVNRFLSELDNYTIVDANFETIGFEDFDGIRTDCCDYIVHCQLSIDFELIELIHSLNGKTTTKKIDNGVITISNNDISTNINCRNDNEAIGLLRLITEILEAGKHYKNSVKYWRNKTGIDQLRIDHFTKIEDQNLFMSLGNLIDLFLEIGTEINKTNIEKYVDLFEIEYCEDITWKE